MRKPRGIVAAGHEETANAVARVLREGGNAFDAALAGMCAACVAEPVLASLGGGGFLLARTADGRAEIHDFFAHTPRSGRPVGELDFYPVIADFGETQQCFHIGVGSIAVWGVVRGLFDVHRRLGSLPMREILAPAIELARNGVEVNAFQAYVFRIVAPIFLATPEAVAVYGEAGRADRPVGEGRHMRQADLANTLEALARDGEDLFHRGEIGRSLVELCRTHGGCVTTEDLERYRVAEREPLSLRYREALVLTNPPPASGGMLIAFGLKLLESAGALGDFPFGSHAHLDLLATAIAQTNAARVEADAEGSGAGSLLDEALLDRYRGTLSRRAKSFRGTTHISVMDAKGNVAATTLSNGSASGCVLPGTGVMLNNMLGEEDLIPGGFHRWPRDQRISSMMSPSLVCFPDGRVVATGSGGSKRIRTAILQVLVNIVDHGMSIDEAVSRPRIFLEDDLLSVEAGFDAGEIDALVRSYPKHELWGRLNLFFGGAHTVEREGATFRGAGDPRRGGVCIVA